MLGKDIQLYLSYNWNITTDALRLKQHFTDR